MIPTLSFRPQALGRFIALLGEAEVAEIVSYEGDRRARALWRSHLPRPLRSRIPKPEASLAAARRAVERDINDWLTMAGLIDPGAGVRVLLDEAAEACT